MFARLTAEAIGLELHPLAAAVPSNDSKARTSPPPFKEGTFVLADADTDGTLAGAKDHCGKVRQKLQLIKGMCSISLDGWTLPQSFSYVLAYLHYHEKGRMKKAGLAMIRSVLAA
ncbi:hypothetical protein BT69DRAFT_1353690 [Atractiella rhizophila]|nr:hypothetical protein BT69DRAFT_1353690 [Atractiella rhizophila]